MSEEENKTEVNLTDDKNLTLSEEEKSEYVELHTVLSQLKMQLANNVLMEQQLIAEVGQMGQEVVDKLTSFAQERDLDVNEYQFDTNIMSFKPKE